MIGIILIEVSTLRIVAKLLPFDHISPKLCLQVVSEVGNRGSLYVGSSTRVNHDVEMVDDRRITCPSCQLSRYLKVIETNLLRVLGIESEIV